MSPELEQWGFGVFLIFCRIGSGIMLAPGFASARIPVKVRLLSAAGCVLAVSPVAAPPVVAVVESLSDADRLLLIGEELAAGITLGLMARLFFFALQAAANIIASAIGLAGIPGVALEEHETGSPLAALASAAATVIVFSAGLHIEFIRAVLDSYRVIGPGSMLDPSAMLNGIVEALTETTLLMLRLASPFIAYGVVLNVALGLANRFVPQISVYHATTGTVILGGLALYYFLLSDWIVLFANYYQNWLERGGF